MRLSSQSRAPRGRRRSSESTDSIGMEGTMSVEQLAEIVSLLRSHGTALTQPLEETSYGRPVPSAYVRYRQMFPPGQSSVVFESWIHESCSASPTHLAASWSW